MTYQEKKKKKGFQVPTVGMMNKYPITSHAMCFVHLTCILTFQSDHPFFSSFFDVELYQKMKGLFC
jgi:hypothetical protein